MKKTIFLSLILFSLNIFANEFSVPHLSGPIVDYTNIISQEDKVLMEQKIRNLYSNGAGPQITVLTINSLNGLPIEDVAHKVFTTWGLGDKRRDDGVLFLISINDRKMRIEVGQGLEGSLTDLKSHRILGGVKPLFKKSQYSQGINYGLDQIIAIVSKQDAVQNPTNVIQSTKEEDEKIRALGITLLIAVVILMFSVVFFKESKKENKILNKQIASIEHRIKKTRDEYNGVTAADLAKKVNELQLTSQNLYKNILEADIKLQMSDFFLYERLVEKLDKITESKQSLKEDIEYYKTLKE